MDTPRSKTVPTRSPRHAGRPARRALALAVVAVLSLSACASGLARKDEVGLKYADYAGEPVDTVRTLGAVNGWTPVSRTQLVIWTGVNEAWLLTVWDSCRDLTFANSISVTQSGRQITKFDRVLVGEERCAITEIRPVDVKQMKADRKAVKAAP
jgi:hypothetical protein